MAACPMDPNTDSTVVGLTDAGNFAYKQLTKNNVTG